jgi:hypothetical protein
MKKYTEPMEITLKATEDKQSRNLAIRFAFVLSGLAITLGICVGTAGHASATTCATVASELAAHNARYVNQYNGAAVDAYNAEADYLNGVARSCGYTLHP